VASPALEEEPDAGLPEGDGEEADPLGGLVGAELQELEGSVLAADLDLGVKGFAELLY
jgi:hypothetical protein